MVNFLIFQSTGRNKVDTNIETVIIKRCCQNEGGKKLGNPERPWVRDLRKTLSTRLVQNFLQKIKPLTLRGRGLIVNKL